MSIQSFRRALWFLAASTVLLLQGCAVVIDHSDVFSMNRTHPKMSDPDWAPKLEKARLSEIKLEVRARHFQGYRYASPQARRAVIFFPGNGYSAADALARMAELYVDEQTDLYIVSYGLQGEKAPEVAEVYAMSRELAAHAARTSQVDPAQVFAIGHSLGGWIVLNLASTNHIGCAVAVGTGTTAVETAKHLLPKSVSMLSSLRPTADVALLDNPRQAEQVRVPTLVVASDADQVMPPERARTFFSQLPVSVTRELFVAQGVSHGGYFRDDAVTQKIQSFLQGPCSSR